MATAATTGKAETKGVEITGIQLDIGRSSIDSSHVLASIDSSHVLSKGSFADVFRGTYRFSGHQVENGVAVKTFRGAHPVHAQKNRRGGGGVDRVETSEPRAHLWHID